MQKFKRLAALLNVASQIVGEKAGPTTKLQIKRQATMLEYFKNLNTIDPLFHALVLSRIRSIQEREGSGFVSIDALTEEDELEILREYCMTLYKEYRTLRTVFLENMQVSGRSVGLKHSAN
ncbi:MAG TPA: hypothetical protein DGH68_13145 [Bacteroidetes bacterium]|nr:hypothetical protein [Bacteroidota bacterium]